MSYDAVLFDFDGVIVEPPSSKRLYDALERTYEAFDTSRPDAETVRSFLRGDFEAIAARCRRLGVDADAFCRRAARELIRTQRRDVERGLRSAYDDVVALRSLESSLGLVSDNHPIALSVLLDRTGLDTLFDVVYGCPLTRAGLERRKPSPDNITAAMATLEAETALYVGDRSVDVEAARNAGVDSALLSRDGDATDPRATYRLASLRELPPLLE